MIKKQLGFSLIEVIVSLMLMGLLGVAGMEMLKMQNKNQVSTEANFDAIDLANDIRTVLSSPRSCGATFNGKSFSNGTNVDPIVRSLKDPSTGAYTNSTYLKVNDQRGQRLKVKSLSLVSVDTVKRLASLEVIAEGVNAEAKNYKKTIPLTILVDKTNPSIIDSCVAVGGPPIDPVELCAMTGGTYANGQCQTKVDLETGLLPTYCPPGSQMKMEEVNGKPRVNCTPCPAMEKFSGWGCDKPFKGMNWVHMCFYRTVCQNNQAIELFPTHWDQKAGPTSASGNDTGTKKNCQKKRRACPGE